MAMAEQTHLISTVKAAKLRFLTSRHRPGPSEYLTQRWKCVGNETHSGVFGQVKRYKNRINGKVYAIKTVKVNSIEQFRSTLQEVVLLSQIPHENIVQCYPDLSWLTSDDNDSSLYLVMDWYDRNLAKLSEDMMLSRKRHTRDQAIGHIRALLEGVHHLHQHDIVHADLKPRNICVTLEDRPIIIDFGLSQFERMPPKEQRGPRSRYNPPEHLVSKERDIWAIGMMLLDICFLGTANLDENYINTLCELVLNDAYRPSVNARYSDQLREYIQLTLNLDNNFKENQIMCEVIVQCLSYDSVLRPSVSTLLQIFGHTNEFREVVAALELFCGYYNIPFHWNMIFGSWYKCELLPNIEKSGLIKDKVVIMKLESFMENYDFPFLGIMYHFEVPVTVIERLANAYLSGLAAN